MNNDSARGVHNGYGKDHIRKFYLEDNKLIINDFCRIKRKKSLLFNFHPNVFLKHKKLNHGIFQSMLSHNDLQDIYLEINNVKNFEIVDGRFSSGFGKPKINKMLKIEIKSNFSKTIFSW